MEPVACSLTKHDVRGPASGDSVYGTAAIKWMSMVQLALGFMAMVLLVVAVVVCRAIGILNVAVSIFFVVNGMFSAISTRKPSPTLLLAVVTSGFLSILSAAFFLYLASYGSLVGQRPAYLRPGITWEILQGILMFICLVEGVLSTIFAVFACRILCSCCQLQVFLAPSKEHSSVDLAPTAPSPFYRTYANSYRIGSDSSGVFFQDRNSAPPQYKEVV